ncbi:MAG: DUF3795 domain-containing protein [Tenuifilaceae bacterium]
MIKDSKVLMIAPCGMNCAICLAYLRTKNHCAGCWGSNENKPNQCVNCIIKNCELLANTESKFCYDCERFPCPRLKRLDKRYQTKYKMSMLENLEFIKSKGLTEFIEKEGKRWKCESCGGTICVHRAICLDCMKN